MIASGVSILVKIARGGPTLLKEILPREETGFGKVLATG